MALNKLTANMTEQEARAVQNQNNLHLLASEGTVDEQTIFDELAKKTSESSGAELIGVSPIGGIEGYTAQAVLETLGEKISAISNIAYVCYLNSDGFDFTTPKYYANASGLNHTPDGVDCYIANPIKLKAGTYFFQNIWAMFSFYSSDDKTYTGALSSTGNVTNCSFTFEKDVTVYCTALGIAKGKIGVISGDKSIADDYDVGVVQVITDSSLTNDKLPANAKAVGDKFELFRSLSSIRNATHILDIIDAENHSTWNGSQPDSDLTANPMHFVVSTSGNRGIIGSHRLCIDQKHPIVKLKFTISDLVIGGINVYLFGKSKTSTSDTFTRISIVDENGSYELTVDLAYYDVYSNIDVTQYTFLFANRGETDLKIGDISISYVDSDSFIENESLCDILENITNDIQTIDNKTYENFMMSPNGKKYIVQVANDGSISSCPVVPNKTLFIGNSLLNGNGSFGMCASDENHDYYHYVTNQITAKDSTATFTKLSGTGFESCTSESAANSWFANTLASKLSSDLDLVIVQLGDNVNTTDKVSAFRTTCKLMLQYIRNNCPSARVAWVGEWYSSNEKQSIIANACADTGCMFINIADLSTNSNQSAIGNVIHKTTSSTTTYTVDSYTDDTENKQLTITFTVNSNQYTSVLPYDSYTNNSNGTITVTGYYTIVTSGGVASHPGDNGMLAIANRICYKLGITDSENAITE